MNKSANPKDFLVIRILNKKKWKDYIVMASIAALPIFFSLFIEVAYSTEYAGKLYCGYIDSYNWLSFVLILPITLYVLRLVMFNLAGSIVAPGAHIPPVIQLFKTVEDNTSALVEDFQRSVLQIQGLIYALIGAVIIHLLDMSEVISIYYKHLIGSAFVIREHDWSVLFTTGKVSAAANMCLVIMAYFVQFIVTFFGLWLVFLLFKHNYFFLSRVYQRRFSGGVAQTTDIVIQLKDRNRCFGFRPAYRAFNTQVLFLTIAGIAMLVSRFFNVNVEQSKVIYSAIGSLFKAIKWDFSEIEKVSSAINVRVLFHDSGQIVLAFAWLVLFLVVSMPSFVKLLPFLRRRKIEWLLEAYLREMLPDKDLGWKSIYIPTDSEITTTSEKFAMNSFWPTGDNRAKVLFWFSFFVFLVLLCPLHFDPDKIVKYLGYYACLCAISWAFSTGFVKILTFPLHYVDKRLVETKK